jgi:hypothetical protein
MLMILPGAREMWTMTVLHGFLPGLMVSMASAPDLPGLYRRGEVTGRSSSICIPVRSWAPELYRFGLRARLLRLLSERNRLRKLEPEPYRAFIIGADGLAIAVHAIVAGFDHEALEKAMQLQGERCIELWCGSRKVADKPDPRFSKQVVLSWRFAVFDLQSSR